MFDRTFSFVVHLPYSRFTFIHHVQFILEEVDSDVEAATGLDAITVEV